MRPPQVSVITPVFEQAEFLRRAVGSLARQTLTDWELVVVDDGSTDATPDVVAELVRRDDRVHGIRHARNRGLGAACNTGLDAARSDLVAYLPADDVIAPDHLQRLAACFDDGVALAWSDRDPPGDDLQLVQVMHRRTDDRWLERRRLETDDLEVLLWSRLRRRGRAVGTGRATATWTPHPGQRHRAILERHDGGLNVFRARYRVAEPLRFHSTDSWPVDEVALYAPLRRPRRGRAPDGLRILLVGELAFNPERVLALEERGHELAGLWIDDPLADSTVGPLPFGHVADLPRRRWREAARRWRPDVVYALLNWRAVPLAHEVLSADLGVPLVWHFKESPQRCGIRGSWSQLAELHARADAVLYASPIERDWFEAALPGRRDPARTAVLDGDLPKADWFRDTASPRLSDRDGELHTVCIGRPVGLDAALVAELAAAGIHLHLHGLVRGRGPSGRWRDWLGEARRAAPDHVHVHPHVDQRSWVRVFSRYDAGWLHRARSRNGGDVSRATWDDLNVPARLAVLVGCGVPVLQQSSPGARVAAQDLVAARGIGVLYEDGADLAAQLTDGRTLERSRRAVREQRDAFAFDTHADRLVDTFREVAA